MTDGAGQKLRTHRAESQFQLLRHGRKSIIKSFRKVAVKLLQGEFVKLFVVKLLQGEFVKLFVVKSLQGEFVKLFVVKLLQGEFVKLFVVKLLPYGNFNLSPTIPSL